MDGVGSTKPSVEKDRHDRSEQIHNLTSFFDLLTKQLYTR